MEDKNIENNIENNVVDEALIKENTSKNNNNQKQIAGAIIIAGLIVAGAILLKGNSNTVVLPQENINKNITILKDDHIFGNKDAKIVIVEYSDTECPFCKVFHNTMHKVVENSDDKVAWIYRHYPIASLHQKAFNESLATECAWEQGGNETFWKYIDEVFKRTESNDRLDSAELPKIASDLGLDLNVFNSCLNTEKYGDKIRSDMASGEKALVNGTPSSFILVKGKVVDTIPGALPYEAIMQKLENIK